MSVEVLTHTPAELAAWRAALVEAVGTDAAGLEEREASGTLTSEEADVLATIRGIDFLLA